MAEAWPWRKIALSNKLFRFRTTRSDGVVQRTVSGLSQTQPRRTHWLWALSAFRRVWGRDKEKQKKKKKKKKKKDRGY